MTRNSAGQEARSIGPSLDGNGVCRSRGSCRQHADAAGQIRSLHADPQAAIIPEPDPVSDDALDDRTRRSGPQRAALPELSHPPTVIDAAGRDCGPQPGHRQHIARHGPGPDLRPALPPTATSVTPSPVSSTTPATSRPVVCGSCAPNVNVPARSLGSVALIRPRAQRSGPGRDPGAGREDPRFPGPRAPRIG